MINSFGGEQDNVVFMGRRSFRMEIAAGPGGNELAIPTRASEIPTERIFGADRDRVFRAATAASLRPARGSSNLTLVALCLTTFAFGIALTLTFTHRLAPHSGRYAIEATPVAPAPAAQVAPPAPVDPIVVQELPPTPPTDAELMAAFALPARRPLAKPARAARPRPVRAAPAATETEAPAPAAAKPWVDPFAE
ncbi:MAG TPA: hypothetical protein VH853_12515 [Polyangia bacterium]|nr:hypothetical protein [Polyangia bacterium]